MSAGAFREEGGRGGGGGAGMEEAEGQQRPDGEVGSAGRVTQAKTAAWPVLLCHRI